MSLLTLLGFALMATGVALFFVGASVAEDESHPDWIALATTLGGMLITVIRFCSTYPWLADDTGFEFNDSSHRPFLSSLVLLIGQGPIVATVPFLFLVAVASILTGHFAAARRIASAVGSIVAVCAAVRLVRQAAEETDKRYTSRFHISDGFHVMDRSRNVCAAMGALFVMAIVLTGCTSAPRVNTAGDLIAQIQRAGIQIDSQGPAPKPTGEHFRFDEGVRIQGPDLFVDILRIEDRRVFDLAKSAGRLLVVAEAVADRPLPESPEVYSRHPFVVVVRQQPEGQVLWNALVKILPPERE